MENKVRKLETLYNECLDELNKIGINTKEYNICLEVKKGRTKTYGMCVKSEPDKNSEYYEKGKKKYLKYNKHTIQISSWVLELKDSIIKNTIMHEIVHCLPGAGNHGIVFKKIAKVINMKLGYNISRLGNKEQDYLESGIVLNNNEEQEKYKYILECTKCHQEFKRKKFNVKQIHKYCCPFCGSKLKVKSI